MCATYLNIYVYVYQDVMCTLDGQTPIELPRRVTDTIY